MPKTVKVGRSFDPHLSSELALAQIHGLDPWPRCSASIAGVRVQFRRGKMASPEPKKRDSWMNLVSSMP